MSLIDLVADAIQLYNQVETQEQAPTELTTSVNGVYEICAYEGVCLRPYYDSVGVITIGFGSTVTEIPDLAKWDKTKYITMDEAFNIFKGSLSRYEDCVRKVVTTELAQSQFDALVSLCYNIGVGGLSKSTLVKRINAKDGAVNITEAFLRWDKPSEIMGRRKKEEHLYRTGIYSNPQGLCEMLDTDGAGHQTHRTAKIISIKDLL